MANNEDDGAKRKADIVIGEDLDKLSVDELEERIGILEVEIARLRVAIDTKQDVKSAADTFFRN